MGCDIHSFCEKLTPNGWVGVYMSPFSDRRYSVFGFLADIRNYSDVPPISLPRGLPNDVSILVKDEYGDGIDWHSSSWLTVQELTDFDYDAPMENRRVTRMLSDGWLSGGCTCDPGEGEQTTFREFLGEQFFNDLRELQSVKIDRIVFWFDN